MSDFLGVSEDVKAQLLRLKDLTRRTGVLQEPQVLTLKMWGLGVFNAVTEASIEQEGFAERTVRYILRMKSKPRGQEKLKIATLEQCVRSLLGNDWSVEIRVRQKKGGRGDLIHRGERLEPIQEASKPQADLPAYEFQNAMTDFRRYRLRDPIAAAAAAVEAADASLSPIKEK